MKKFYFTYGTDEAYPFIGGWTEIIAPSNKAAAQIFRAYHPDRYNGIVNCASCYASEDFENTEVYKEGNFGARCHEVIGAFRPDQLRKNNERSS